jgi:hypothetical protein
LPIILLAVSRAFVYRWAVDLAAAGRLAGIVLCALVPTYCTDITTDMGVVVFGFMAFYFCFEWAGQSTDLKPQNPKFK